LVSGDAGAWWRGSLLMIGAFLHVAGLLPLTGRA
jgi:hypothetical protein